MWRSGRARDSFSGVRIVGGASLQSRTQLIRTSVSESASFDDCSCHTTLHMLEYGEFVPLSGIRRFTHPTDNASNRVKSEKGV